MNNTSGSNLVKREDCALVIIDIQKKLVPVISEVQKVIDNVIKLVKVAKIIDLPIVVTEQEKLGETIEEIKSILDDYHPIQKVSFSCFGCEEFKQELGQLNRNTLLLTGIESHICVTQTALDALPQYLVHSVSDAMSSRVPSNWDIALEHNRVVLLIGSFTESGNGSSLYVDSLLAGDGRSFRPCLSGNV